MSWIRVDDNMADHPKVMGLGRLGPLALGLQMRALCWASRHLTDGNLPKECLPSLLMELDAKVDWPAAMVKAGLWEKTPAGYTIHDYLEYNPSRKETLAARERNAERQRNFRNRNGNGNGALTRDIAVSSAVSNGVSNGPVTLPPSPSPSPTTKSKALLAHAKSARAPLDAEFELAWSAYPKRGGNNPKQDALHAWRARLKAGIPPGTLLAGVQRYAKYCVSTGWVGSRYVMQARRFFGPSQPFAETWEVPVDPDAWKRDPFAFRPGETQEAYIRRTSEGNGR